MCAGERACVHVCVYMCAVKLQFSMSVNVHSPWYLLLLILIGQMFVTNASEPKIFTKDKCCCFISRELSQRRKNFLYHFVTIFFSSTLLNLHCHPSTVP